MLLDLDFSLLLPMWLVFIGALAWLGFAGATSFGTALFSGKPKALWLIDSGFNLVSFIVAGVILTIWR